MELLVKIFKNDGVCCYSLTGIKQLFHVFRRNLMKRKRWRYCSRFKLEEKMALYCSRRNKEKMALPIHIRKKDGAL
jgi:hypothetical protein